MSGKMLAPYLVRIPFKGRHNSISLSKLVLYFDCQKMLVFAQYLQLELLLQIY